METKKEQQPFLFTFSEITRIIRQRLWFILIILAFFIVGAFIYNEVATPLYLSQLKMSISSDQADFRLPNQSYEYQDYYSRVARMETHLAVLKSTDVIKSILSKPAIQQIIAEEEKQTLGSRSYLKKIVKKIWALFIPSYRSPPDKKEQKAIQQKLLLIRLKAGIQAAIKPDTNLIEVSVVDRNPKLAAAVANGLAAAYREHMLWKKMQAVRENLSWMSGEIQKLRKDIRASQGSIEEFSTEQDILLFEQDPTFLSQELGRMKAQENEIRTERAQVDAEIEELKKILVQEDKYVPGFLDSEVLRELHIKLVMAKLEQQSLSKKYKAKHPDMIQKNAEVDFLSEQFDLQLEKTLASLESKSKIIKAKEKSLTGMIDQYRIQTTVKGEEGAELSLLQGEIESNKELYQLLLRQMKSANISETLLKETVEVIEPARMSLAPYRPLKRMNLILAFFMGSFVGIVLALLIDFMEAKIVTQEDVEKYLGLNVVGSLPLFREEEGVKIQEI